MNKKQLAVVAILLIVVIALFVYLRSLPPPKKPNIVTELGGKPTNQIFHFDQDVCPGPTISFKNLDVYLRGVVERDEVVPVAMNWYKCHPPKVGDVVLYRFSWHMEPVLKQIVAIEGDRVDLVQDPEGRGWNIVLNGKVYESSGRRYFVGVSKFAPPLKLYADANGQVLKQGLVVVLSTLPPGEKDSGYFGAVSIQDIVGRVEK